MLFKMDTDAVRAMALRLQQTADTLDGSVTAMKTAMQAAGWQSQAREEFMVQLETLLHRQVRTIQVLRLMARAAERKAEQWEAIASVFNGPFVFLEGAWDAVKSFFGGMWADLQSAIDGIKLPSLPSIVLPGISGAIILGGLTTLLPSWNFQKPGWWPFGKQEGVTLYPDQGGVPDGSSPSPANKVDGGVQSPVVDTVQPVKVVEKPYPQPPATPVLEPATNTPSSYTCATYARDRRPDLGSTQSNNEKFADGAAANYIYKFEEKSFQLDSSDKNLKDVIGPGYAVVWEPGACGNDKTYGHVAIVEKVYSDHVVISEAYRINGVYHVRNNRTLTFDQLNHDQVWLIP